MKPIYGKLISALLTALLFSGCTLESGSSSASSDLLVPVEYIYDQDIVMLDDNYRNFYEVFLYSFYDSNGDGIGDINGLTQKLDYINGLGFNGIWLMPVMKSTTYHKYDVVDYYEIDPQYGTMEDFEKLIGECDKRGIKLIMDMVLNHTSALHEWFLSARRSLLHEPCGEEECIYDDLCPQHNPYCSYYNFTEEKPSGSGWLAVPGTNYYYECVFWDQMPDLNLANENLRRDLQAMAKFWIDKGVGGFRLDAAKEYYTGSVEKNVEVLQWFVDFCKSLDEDFYLVAEVWDSFTSYTKYYQSGIDSIFDFTLADADGKIAKTLNYNDNLNTAKSFGEAIETIDQKIKSYKVSAIDAPFISNHDIARGSGIYKNDSRKIKIAAGMMLMMPGSPFVYYGEEIGMAGSGTDPDKRAPIVWTSNPSAQGMTSGPPDMTVQAHQFASVEEQLGDADSILNYYKRAIRIRNENPEIARGTVTNITLENTETCASERGYNGRKITIVYNLSSEVQRIDDEVLKLADKHIRGYLTSSAYDKVILENNLLTMPAYSIAVIEESY